MFTYRNHDMRRSRGMVRPAHRKPPSLDGGVRPDLSTQNAQVFLPTCRLRHAVSCHYSVVKGHAV
jgi:hypothetical protein